MYLYSVANQIENLALSSALIRRSNKHGSSQNAFNFNFSSSIIFFVVVVVERLYRRFF